MKYCVAGCKKLANIRFPRNRERLKLWTDSLELIPTEHDRLCIGHFQSTDFSVKEGRKFLDVHAVPSKHVYPETSIISLRDHNYAKGMEYGDICFPPEILMFLLFSLLLLFDLFLSSPGYSTPPQKHDNLKGNHLLCEQGANIFEKLHFCSNMTNKNRKQISAIIS